MNVVESLAIRDDCPVVATVGILKKLVSESDEEIKIVEQAN